MNQPLAPKGGNDPMTPPRTIWKYSLKIENTQTLRLPRGWEALSVGADAGGILSFWALVDPSADVEPATILCFGTGHPIDQPLGKFLGTIQQGFFVWHFFLS